MTTIVVLGGSVLVTELRAAEVAQLLSVAPAQREIEVDTPAKDSWGQCRVEPVSQGGTGWQVRDSRGLVVRRFLDTDGNNAIDRWSFFHNGVEVYRDRDTNGDRKPDEFSWYYHAGSRCGSDNNGDGQIDRWLRLSAEEATAEVIAALRARDGARLTRVLLNEDDAKSLQVDATTAERVKQTRIAAQGKLTALVGKLPKDIEWLRFDVNHPVALPGEMVGSSADLMLYQHGTIIVQSGKQTLWLRVSEMVQVGPVWKLVDVPSLLEGNQPVAEESVFMRAEQPSTPAGASVAAAQATVEEDAEIQKLASELQKLDETLVEASNNPKSLLNYHLQRAQFCAQIGSKSQLEKNRHHWYKQTADSLNAAVQTGQYPQGINMMGQYADQFAKLPWGKPLASYFSYRALNAKYMLDLSDPKADHLKVQEQFLNQLDEFLTSYPEAEDRDDALWQLGNAQEFVAQEEAASKHYRALVSQYPDSPLALRAQGALARLEGKGKPFVLTGSRIDQRGSVDSRKYRGKWLVVHYWATWAEPSLQVCQQLHQLQQKFHQPGFEVIGVNIDSDAKTATDYIRKGNITWETIHEAGAMDSAPAVRYGIISLPYVLIVNPNGSIQEINVQPTQLEAMLQQIVAAPEKMANGQGALGR